MPVFTRFDGFSHADCPHRTDDGDSDGQRPVRFARSCAFCSTFRTENSGGFCAGGFQPAGCATNEPRPDTRPDAATASHSDYARAGRTRDRGAMGAPRSKHLRLAGSAGVPLPLCGSAQPAAGCQWPRNIRYYHLWRRPSVARGGVLGQSGDRPGIWAGQQLRGRRLSQRRGVQARPDRSLRPAGARIPAPDHRSGRRRPRTRPRPEPAWRHADRQPGGDHRRQVLRRRHLRHQPICA